MLGMWEILVIFMVILLLFGGKKLPELAKSLGLGIREFKKASQGIVDEVQQGVDMPSVDPRDSKADYSFRDPIDISPEKDSEQKDQKLS